MRFGFLTAGWLFSLLSLQLSASPDLFPLGPYGGDVRSLAVHPERPNTFFLGTADGQIFVSANAGANWERLVPGLNRRHLVVDNLVFDPRNPDIIYAGAWELKSNKGWLFRTRDVGKTWQMLPLTPHDSAIRAIAIAPSNSDIMAVGISEGVLLSTDAGDTWTRITRGYRNLYNVESLAFDPLDSNMLYVGTWRLGWKTPDLGRTWEPIHQGMHWDSDMFSVLVNPKDPDILYASACTGVYKSVNGGRLWAKLTKGPTGEARRTRILEFSPDDPQVVYAGTTLGLFVTDDAGDSWRQLISDVVVNAVAIHPDDSRVVLVGTDDAGVLRSENGGSTFVPTNEGFIHRHISALSLDPEDPKSLYAAVSFDSRYGGFFFSNDGGGTWQPHNEGLGGQVSGITAILAANDSDKVYLGTSGGLFSGAPGDQPWSLIQATKELDIFDLTLADPQDDAIFIAGGSGIFRFSPATEKLDKLKLPVPAGKARTIFFDDESGYLFAGTDIGVFRSEDRGDNWTIKVKGLPPDPVNILERSAGRLLCGTRKGLFSSGDHGETWVRAKGVHSIEIAAIKANPFNRTELYAADFLVGYLYRSEDGGDTWEVVNLEMPGLRISHLAFPSSETLLAGTHSDGVLHIAKGRVTKRAGGGSVTADP